ncbi:E3 SUMO-protein ligase pli1 [Elasticomyces elasticus]|nr:E3 SUMO-protein ligase pli1 [Elasticomyces elasticus]
MAASAGHMLQQSSARVVTQLKRLVNSDLKDICKAYGKVSSGNKAQLQTRCIEILTDLEAKGDPEGVEDFNYRVQNKGQARPRQGPAAHPNTHTLPTGGYTTYRLPPGGVAGMSAQNRLPNGGKYFKYSPFYEIQDTVVALTDLPGGAEMPQNRNTIRSTIILSAEQAQRMANNSDMRILMYCGVAQGMTAHSATDIAFPNQVEVKVNEDEVKSNFKGLKNKPGSTKPADLTQKIRVRANYPNHMTVTYALTTKRYAFVVYLVQYVSAAKLTERIKIANIIPKDHVIAEMRKANADPDIEATSTRMSLKDPVSTVRITLPVRSTVCTHTQCFDGAMFMQLVEQAPQWNCPVCNKAVTFQSLCVDKYFEDILARTPKSIEKVDVEPDGEWRVIKEEEDQQPAGTTSKPRASYDDDFDDDLMEVPDPSNKPINGLKARESQPPGMFGGGPPFSINTPPLSSREPSVAQSAASGIRAGSKRPSGAVIDLTLSDDDDEPPRPAKRQQTTTTSNQQGTQNSHSAAQQYNTPSSLPDHTRYQPPAPPKQQQQPPLGSFRQADFYRPSTGDNAYRPSPSGQTGPAPPSPLRPANGQQQQQQQPFLSNGVHQHQHTSIFGNNNITSNSLSPAAQQTSTPAYPFGAVAARPSISPWPAQHSRPPSVSNGLTPFSIRPPHSPGGMQSPQQGMNGMRLPPMQTSLQPPPTLPPATEGYYGGWRSDQGSHSRSPG